MAQRQRAELEIAAVDSTRAAFDAIERRVTQMERGFGRVSSAAGRIGSLLTGGAAAGAIVAVTRATIEEERSQNRLAAAIRATGSAAGVTRDEIEGMVASLHESTPFDDEEIRSGITALLRFREVQGDTFREAVRLGPDVAAALGTDLVGAYQRLGRVIQDPLGGMRSLRAAGVDLNQSQIDLIKNLQLTGDAAGAAALLLREVEKSVGGAAAGENRGLFKATTDVAKAWDDMLQALGKRPENPIGQVLGGASALLRDIKATIEGTHSPFTQLILDAANFADKLSLGSTALFGVTDRIREALTTSSRSGTIRHPARERIEALQGQIDAATQAAEARAVERGRSERQHVIPTLISGELDAQRAAVNRTRQILDDYHREALLSESEYYASRRDLIARELAAEVNAIENSLALARTRVAEATTPAERDQARADIVRLTARRDQVQQDAAQENIRLTIEQQRETRRFAERLEEVNAELLELRGNAEAAAALRFDIQNRELSRFLDRNPDIPGVAAARGELRESRTLVTQEARAGAIETEAGQTQQRLFNRETEIDALRRRGALSEIQAMRRTSAARAQAVQELGELRDTYAELAAEADPSTPRGRALILQAETLNARIIELSASVDVLGGRLQDVTDDAGKGFIKEMLDGAKDIEGAFDRAARRIKERFDDLVADSLWHDLLGVLDLDQGRLGGILGGVIGGGRGGGMGGQRLPPWVIDESGAYGGINRTAGGGGFGAVGELGRLGQTLFGAPGLEGPTPSGGNISGGAIGTLFDWFKNLLGFAEGGDFFSGRPIMVGEKGPELIFPKVPGTVIPNHALAAAAPGNVFTQHNTFMLSGPITGETQRQIASRVYAAGREAFIRTERTL